MPTYIIILTIILLIILVISWILANLIIKPKVIDYGKLYDFEVEAGRLDEQLYDSWHKEEFTIRSTYGYSLSCMLINNELSKKQFNQPNKKKKIAIILHGIKKGKLSSMVYAKYFLERGITVLVYDQRNHGLSDKAYTTMGYYEKFDLQTIIDWCYIKYDGNVSIITHGESMGAATVLSHLAIDGRVNLVIADCGFSDFIELTKYIVKNKYHLPQFPFVFLSSLLITLRARFPIKHVVPKDALMITDKPILFIHGLDDDFIPSSMSEDMYNIKPENKEIFLVPGAGHAKSVTTDPEGYKEALNDFLGKYNY